MANVVEESVMKETKEFAEVFENLSEKNKSYMLGYMTCMANSQDNITPQKQEVKA